MTPAENSLPDVSVVISVKNRAAMMGDCIAGLLAQTLARERFELVLVDNVSTEDLRAVADAAREAGLNVTYLRTEHDGGPAPARNQGVAAARGRIIAFTDSDCRPSPGWLAAGLAGFDDPQVGLVSGPVLPKPGQPIRPTTKITFITRQEHPTFPTANLFMRRETFLALGGFDTSLSFRDPLDRATECADTDLAWRIIKTGAERRFLPEAVMFHELEEQGWMLWMLEPTRLFVLPALIRRHPELRRELLRFGLVFEWRAAVVTPVLLLTALLMLWWPWLLLVPVFAALARAIWRRGTAAPGAVLAQMGVSLLHLPRLMMVSFSLLYGSIRFRSLVL
jgi:glycosyltransferase involved in cell wall biosynthesis